MEQNSTFQKNKDRTLELKTSFSNFRDNLTDFFKYPRNFLPMRVYLILTGVIFLLLGITFKRLSPVVPLYYSLPWGEDQLAKKLELFFIPFSAVVIFLLNMVISLLFLKKDNFLVQLLMWASCVVTLFGLITLTKIIFLVI